MVRPKRRYKGFNVTIMSIALIIISFILFAEVLLEPKNRLEWPYGDVIPGSFIAKACLPVFCALIIFSFHKNLKIMIVMLTILLLGLTALKFTGERSNLILVVCALLTSIVSYKFSLKKFFYISFFAVLIGFFLINNFSSLTKRCTRNYTENCLNNEKRHVKFLIKYLLKL